MDVSVFAMHTQTNGRIWTKLGMKDPYPQGHNLGGSKLGADPRGRSPQGKTPFFSLARSAGTAIRPQDVAPSAA